MNECISLLKHAYIYVHLSLYIEIKIYIYAYLSSISQENTHTDYRHVGI